MRAGRSHESKLAFHDPSSSAGHIAGAMQCTVWCRLARTLPIAKVPIIYIM